MKAEDAWTRILEKLYDHTKPREYIQINLGSTLTKRAVTLIFFVSFFQRWKRNRDSAVIFWLLFPKFWINVRKLKYMVLFTNQLNNFDNLGFTLFQNHTTQTHFLKHHNFFGFIFICLTVFVPKLNLSVLFRYYNSHHDNRSGIRMHLDFSRHHI